MLKTVYKYPIKEEKIYLPLNAEILSVKWVKGEICIYALVDPTETTKTEYEVYIMGTGYTIQENEIEDMVYLGTVIEPNEFFGDLVWHVWIRGKR